MLQAKHVTTGVPAVPCVAPYYHQHRWYSARAHLEDPVATHGGRACTCLRARMQGTPG